MTLLPEPGTELITAWAPGIYPNLPKARYVLARRKGASGLESTFAAVYEPFARPPLQGVRDETELAENATCTAGEIKPIPASGVLLWKATGPNDEMRISLNVAKQRDGLRLSELRAGAGLAGRPAL